MGEVVVTFNQLSRSRRYHYIQIKCNRRPVQYNENNTTAKQIRMASINTKYKQSLI